MHPKRKKHLTIILAGLGICGTIIGLILYALSQNINLFYSPAQIANGEAPLNKSIRVGGLVVDDSVKQSPDSLKITFVVRDNHAKLSIEFEGILPDLFREGQGIVAKGKLQSNGIVIADEVLAKHDENYMPPELEGMLKENHNPSANAAQ